MYTSVVKICHDDAISCGDKDEDEVGLRIFGDDEDEFGMDSSTWLLESSNEENNDYRTDVVAQPIYHPEIGAQLCQLFSTLSAMNTMIILENLAAFHGSFYNLGKHLEVIIKYENRPMAYLETLVNFEMFLISFMSYKNVKNRMGASNVEARVSLRRKLEGCSQKVYRDMNIIISHNPHFRLEKKEKEKSTPEFHVKDGSKTANVIVEDGVVCETKSRKKSKLIDDNQFMERRSKMVSYIIDTKLNEIEARINMQKKFLPPACIEHSLFTAFLKRSFIDDLNQLEWIDHGRKSKLILREGTKVSCWYCWKDDAFISHLFAQQIQEDEGGDKKEKQDEGGDKKEKRVIAFLH
ncbi:hypothetical protein GIB67_017968 [Kingdonia uniflora]|uniref:Uncharacterized protein n=1 Tax=Kingdonia uniflora TaxID=39325 RepID=A0A7J7MI70_9MAGN|nr:hypothetical protein GIB67_017968 [Kingdonia uniflora]